MATPELFAEALFTDTSSWAVIDRGPFEALLPITHVLENMLRSFDPASPGKTQLEVSECVKASASKECKSPRQALVKLSGHLEGVNCSQCIHDTTDEAVEAHKEGGNSPPFDVCRKEGLRRCFQ